MEPSFRRAARLVAVDRDNRVLLFRYRPPAGAEFWATPGGGAINDESFEQAAEREASEELGLKEIRIEPLWERVTDFLWGEQKIRQHEKYFLLRLEPQEFAAEVRETHHQENIVEARWWTLPEIESSAELIFPEDLATRMRSALALDSSR